MKKYLQSTLLITAFAAITSVSSADVTLISEDFNYGATAGALTGASGGSGFSANWAAQGTPNGQYNPANLTSSATGYVNTAGSTGSYSTDGLTLNNALGGNYNLRNITSPDAYLATAGNTVWFSFLSQVGSTSGQNVSALSFSNLTGMFTNTQLLTGISNGSFSLQINTTAQSITGTAAVSVDTTYLIVGQFVSGGTGSNDTMNVWFNPTDVSTTALLASTAQASSSATGFNFKAINNNFLDGIQLAIRDAGSGSAISSLDAIRFSYGGTSESNFSAVVVPEPSTYAALLGLCALGFVAIRRRR